jgi:hypothetical protein
MKCDGCGKTEEATRCGEFEAMPPGWLRRTRTFCGEVESETDVCSEVCARLVVAREKAEQEAIAADYARRKAAGELSPMERWLDQEGEALRRWGCRLDPATAQALAMALQAAARL